jgi:deazaflavin-dependent oxidoreductase (nitroreductase family)
VRSTKAFQRRVLNPVVRRLVERGWLRGWVVLETIGRRSGEPRRTPVGYALDGDTVWIVAEFGRRAQYVKNIEADARVRVCLRGRWRRGTAALAPEEDPRGRLPRNLNSVAVRAVGTDLLAIRIDLDA